MRNTNMRDTFLIDRSRTDLALKGNWYDLQWEDYTESWINDHNMGPARYPLMNLITSRKWK